MQPAFVVRFHPSGPWRIGPDSGARDRVESVLHSDALYSAVSAAMDRLGLLPDWLAATFTNPDGPAVRFTSCFPFQDELLFVVPPLSLWPPPPSLKIRWKGARFVPAAVVEALLSGRPLEEEAWRVDGASKILIPADWKNGPFRTALRTRAAVDRRTGNGIEHRSACLEFQPGAGMWALGAYADEDRKTRWEGPVQSAFRLLADSGLGGERSSGWGCSRAVDFRDGALPGLLLNAEPDRADEGVEMETAYWFLSLFSPGASDDVDWTRGNYSLLTRTGRVDSPSVSGALKKPARMVAEGSVLFSAAAPSGAVLDAAPEGAPHPVYRAGFAVAVSIPFREAQR